MALEASDMNDGTILQQTKQTKDDRGNIQFSIILPMGKLLKSEYVNPDNAREALKAWLNVVKEQAIAEAKEQRLLQQRKAKPIDVERREGDDQPLFRAGGARALNPDVDKAAEDIFPANPKIVPAVADESVGYPSAERRREDAQIAQLDPVAYAQKQYEYYAIKVESLKPELALYQKRMAQWSTVLKSLAPSNGEHEEE